MLSLIICARNSDISTDLKANIDSTIGIPYEIVLIDNSANQYSIFSAYNEGVKRSRYPYVCFMHDDISYHTNNWGELVMNYFNDPDTGAIGIAGSPYVSLMPGPWWACGFPNINIIQWRDKNKGLESLAYPELNSSKNQVINLDGVWFCIKKELFNTIRFDEVNFSGFHFYDMDISMQIHQAGYKSYCVFDIFIEHFSKGDLNQNWYDNEMIFKKKWRKQLPASCIKLSYAEQCRAELKTIKEFVIVMLQNKYPHKYLYKTAFSELTKFYKGWLYPPIIFQLGKYLLLSI